MKINNECARRVLIEIEKIPYGETITVEKLQEKIMDYGIEDTIHIVTNFSRENYIMLFDKRGYDESDVLRDNKIKCLTEKGCRSLDYIRSDKLWNEMKEKIDNFQDLTIYTIFEIGRAINNVKYNEIFDLPRDY